MTQEGTTEGRIQLTREKAEAILVTGSRLRKRTVPAQTHAPFQKSDQQAHIAREHPVQGDKDLRVRGERDLPVQGKIRDQGHCQGLHRRQTISTTDCRYRQS